MSTKSLFKFWGLVIAIAIAFIAGHNLQLPSKLIGNGSFK
jgi:multiple sugar transport system substrate-binding protein